MADLTETLVALGRCETIVDDLRRERSRLPVEIEAAEARITAARDAVSARRKALEEAQSAHRARERELQDAEARRAKFQAQAPMVKTNVEYTALLHEIDRASELVSELETGILEALEAVDEGAEAVRRVEAEEGERERAAQHEVEQLRERLGEVTRALEEKEGERAQLTAVLPAEARSRYDRVCRSGGLGTSFIVGRSCGRCHRDVPFQVINQVQAGDLAHCGNCGRILIASPEA